MNRFKGFVEIGKILDFIEDVLKAIIFAIKKVLKIIRILK